jgi:hypothetical protein
MSFTRIYIDGLPGTGKHDLASRLSQMLGLPMHKLNTDSAIDQLKKCEGPGELAIWLLWCKCNFLKFTSGVFVGSPETWQCLYNQYFEVDSQHVCAQATDEIQTCFVSPAEPDLRIVICRDLEKKSNGAQQEAIQTYIDRYSPIIFDPSLTTIETFLDTVKTMQNEHAVPQMNRFL